MRPKLLSIVNALIPDKCGLCQCISDSGFCLNCQELLPWTNCCCEICGIHLPTPGNCGSCQKRPPGYSDSCIPFRYQPPVDQLIQQLKYSGNLSIVTPLSRMLSLWITKNTESLPDLIAPIPLHYCRLFRRGFNQAALISKTVSKELIIPVDYRTLQRTRNTVSQTGLKELERQNNLKNAFKSKLTVQGKHVAVLDDVVTSGSTVNAAAQSLIRAGARRVSVWAIAKT